MPKITEFLFGSSPKISVKPKSTLDPAQQEILADLGSMLGGNLAGLQSGERTAPQFEGDLATQLDPSQTASLAGLTSLADQISGASGPFEEARTGLQEAKSTPSAASRFEGGDFGAFEGEFNADGRPAGEFQRQVFDETPADFDAYFTAAVQDPLLQNFQDRILPGISRAQGPSGFYSGDRIRQDELAQEALLGQLTQQRAAGAFQADQARRNRMLTAAQGIDQLTGEGLQREFTGGQSALDRMLTAAQTEEGTGRALAISDADREAQTAIQSALGISSTAQAEGATLGGIVSAGETARQADAENIAREYSDFLRTAGYEDEQIGLLMDFLGLQTMENIVKNKPGTTGLLSEFLVAGASAAGSAAGAAAAGAGGGGGG